ncbi:hypothetical protein NDU88_001472 [Pleurodeles waltl]|uniref:Uncharacterized protein n=1 Tax=Pleurodeles waltl TaxID=8319 RepID=A0AAV7SD11_PLEWA|nr:hypothetical protein NDU88_001472 [Pleurodeles waltl]
MCIGAAGGIRRALLSELHGTAEKLRKADSEAALNSTANNNMITLEKQWGDTETRLRNFDYRYHTARLHTEGARSSRMLAWLAKGTQQHTPINAIRLDTGVIVNTQSEINNAFRQYYARLYQAEPPSLAPQLVDFFRTSHVNQLTTAQALELDKPIESD